MNLHKNLRTPGLTLILATLFLACPARAQLLWDWTYTTVDLQSYQTLFSGSGTITTASSTSYDGVYKFTGYLVTDVTGTWSDSGVSTTITGVDPFNPNIYNDNLLAASSPQLSRYGFAFTTASGIDYDIFYFGTGPGGYSALSPSYVTSNNGIFTATEVPEPSQYGWGLLLTTLGFVAWRRFFARAARTA